MTDEKKKPVDEISDEQLEEVAGGVYADTDSGSDTSTSGGDDSTSESGTSDSKTTSGGKKLFIDPEKNMN
jgi:hypothetical protein